MIAKTDVEWSKRVSIIYAGECAWPKCNNRYGIGAHHVFGRGIQGLRLLVENGVLLCGKHHRKMERVSKRKGVYKKLMVELIGEEKWRVLEKIFNQLMVRENKDSPPSSKLEI